jgi:DNA-binding NtrC family response regulator
MPHVLIVDDDANTREALAALATQEGFTTAVAGSVAEARIQLVRQRPDVVLMDLRLPDGSGIDLFEDLEDRSSIETILITGHASVESAVEALRLRGASASRVAPAITVPVGTPLSVAARDLILSTLEHCGGERKRTAEMLGICTKTLYNRLREYGIREEHSRSSLGDHSRAS